MYKLSISPDQVNQTLSKHILADGFDLTFDMEKSNGVYIYDSKYDRTLLDFFTCFASVPLGYNHPKMVNDEEFKKNLMQAALTNPSNSDIYTTQYAQFVETFSRVGIPEYLPHAFFIAGGSLAIENALKVAMDWTTLPGNIQCLMIAIPFAGRAIPLLWQLEGSLSLVLIMSVLMGMLIILLFMLPELIGAHLKYQSLHKRNKELEDQLRKQREAVLFAQKTPPSEEVIAHIEQGSITQVRS